MSKPHMVVVSRLPAPYREPLFQRIHEHNKIRITVVYEMKRRAGTAWGLKETGLEAQFTYTRQYCNDIGNSYLSGISGMARSLIALARLRPDFTLIHGYSYPASWAAILFCFVTRTPYGLRSDSNVHIERVKGVRRLLKGWVLSWLVKGAEAIFYIGSANRDYWKKYGAIASQLKEARYAIDHSLYSPQPSDEQTTDRIRFLFVGRLIGRKNCDILVRAFLRAIEMGSKSSLTILGDGPQEPLIKDLIKNVPAGQIVYLGAKAPADIPAIYRQHDVLVCPYVREPWGLTINEAMASGLAVIAITSGTVGAAIDLVIDGRNGIGLSESTETSLLGAIRSIEAQPSQLMQMKAESLQIGSEWTYQSAQNAMEEATIACTLKKSH